MGRMLSQTPTAMSNRRWRANMTPKQRERYLASENERKRRRYTAFPERFRERAKSYCRNRRAVKFAFIARWKVVAGCIDCGYSSHPAALEFDHVKGTKKGNVSRFAGNGSSWKCLICEIEKCVVRCANCHRISTFQRRDELTDMIDEARRGE